MSSYRAYEYDAFISHNAFDGASQLAADLNALGAMTYCDEATDLSDRRVRDRLGEAIARARLVLVHTPQGFRDSPWCRAEYRYALAQGPAAAIARVAVATSGDANSVPELLREEPTFQLPEDIERLAQYIIEANDLGPDIGVAIQEQRDNVRTALFDESNDPLLRGTGPLELVSAVRWRLEAGQQLGADDLEDLANVGELAVRQRDSDLRTNGQRAFILLAAATGTEDSLRRVAACLRREASASVLRESLWLYFRLSLPAPSSAKWLAPALVRAAAAGTIENCKPFISAFPSAAQCRVLLGTLQIVTLDISERLTLLENRIDRLLQQPSDDWSLVSFEIEGSLRDLLPYLHDDQQSRDAVDERYEQIVMKVLEWSELRGGQPIRKMGEYACDVLVEPLARMMASAEASSDIFEKACDLVETHAGGGKVVRRLREMGRQVRSGSSWFDAQLQTRKPRAK